MSIYLCLESEGIDVNNKEQTFANRHPKLNLLLGLLLLIGTVFFVIWLVTYIFNLVVAGIETLGNIASNMDAVIIVALITGAVSLVGVIISSLIAKIVDYRKSRQEYLAQKREEPYGEFVEMIYKIQRNTNNPGSYSDKQMFEDISKFSKQITLWGSHNVVNKWIEFREKSSEQQKSNDLLFITEDIMNEMRKDLGLKKVKKGKLLGFFINDIKTVLKK